MVVNFIVSGSITYQRYDFDTTRVGTFVLTSKVHAGDDGLDVLGCVHDSHVGVGREIWDFTYDAVQGLLLHNDCGVIGIAYNLSSWQSNSIKELAHQLLRLQCLERHTQLLYIGRSWTRDAQRFEVDINRSVGLGYRASVALPNGLAVTAGWFDQLGQMA